MLVHSFVSADRAQQPSIEQNMRRNRAGQLRGIIISPFFTSTPVSRLRLLASPFFPKDKGMSLRSTSRKENPSLVLFLYFQINPKLIAARFKPTKLVKQASQQYYILT
jgi:hypothetical protein